jgi:hypothetical protein
MFMNKTKPFLAASLTPSLQALRKNVHLLQQSEIKCMDSNSQQIGIAAIIMLPTAMQKSLRSDQPYET